MSRVLGFEFYHGPQIPKSQPIDFTLPAAEVLERRRAWVEAIAQGIRDHDAWAVLTVWPDMTIRLHDVSVHSVFDATGHGGEVHLLLAKEARLSPAEPPVMKPIDDWPIPFESPEYWNEVPPGPPPAKVGRLWFRCCICNRRGWRGIIWHGTASDLKTVMVHKPCGLAAGAEFLRGLRM